MSTRYYKCTLLSDAIISQSLTTAGNVATLDYIPGSVFMGVVAKEIYDKQPENAYRILHSGKVKFGDGLITNKEELSYHYPLSLYRDKLKSNGNTYLHHLLTEKNYPENEKGFKIQLKQRRTDFFCLESKTDIQVAKSFTIKSARDKETRKSKDEQMFGYESIKTGQSFIFPVFYDHDEDIIIVEKALTGTKRVGKSRTAEYSLAKIDKLDKALKHNCIDAEEYTLVYAHSNLCFLDENGQPNLQPVAEDMGIKGTVDWAKSQIRTYEYSSWNAKRNTPNAQRYCIARGSVFYIKGANKGEEKIVGEYQAEGLGHILINPAFLFEVKNETVWALDFTKPSHQELAQKTDITTDLAKFLTEKKEVREEELSLSKEVADAVKKAKDKFEKITKSQWGSIRNYASNISDSDELFKALFEKAEQAGEESKGYLMHGVAYDRYWSNGNAEKLQEIIKDKSPAFVAKFAAQMVKEKQK